MRFRPQRWPPGPSTAVSQQERDYVRLNQAAAMNLTDAVPPVQAKELRVRGGLPNVFAKLRKGQDVTIAYFGGSITAHPGWRPMTFEWFQKQFPNAKLTMLNASVGGTGSLVGAFRADADLVSRKPDLVFIEFAVNDGGDARQRPKEVLCAMEGIVRKLWQSKPDTDICIVYTLQGPDVDTLNSGWFQNAANVHEKIADHYGLPSIHMGYEVAAMAKAGKLLFTAPMTSRGKTSDGENHLHGRWHASRHSRRPCAVRRRSHARHGADARAEPNAVPTACQSP